MDDFEGEMDDVCIILIYVLISLNQLNQNGFSNKRMVLVQNRATIV